MLEVENEPTHVGYIYINRGPLEPIRLHCPKRME